MNSNQFMTKSHSTSQKKHVRFIESNDFPITYIYDKQKSSCMDNTKKNIINKISNSSNSSLSKYSYIPGVSKMKHLSNDIIETLFSRENITKSRNTNIKDSVSDNKSSSYYLQQQSFPINLKMSNSRYINFKNNRPKSKNKKSLSINSNMLIKNNKLLFANMGVSKKRSLLQLATQSREMSKSNNEETNSNNLFLQKGKIKRSSLVDRYMFKIANPDGVMEDYIIEGDKPGDKYKRFKNQILKGKNKVYRLIQDVKRTQMISDTMISVYITRLKGNRFHRHNKTMSY